MFGLLPDGPREPDEVGCYTKQRVQSRYTSGRDLSHVDDQAANCQTETRLSLLHLPTHSSSTMEASMDSIRRNREDVKELIDETETCPEGTW